MNYSHANHAGRTFRTSPAKGAKRFSSTLQPSLFVTHQHAFPGCMNDAAMVRAVLVDAMKKSGLSRAQIADQMSVLTGTTVTERMLNAFAADSREDHRFPAELDRSFCAVTRDDRLLTCRVEAAGLHVIDETGWQLLELGREFLRQKEAAQNMASLERLLQGVQLA